MTFATTLLNIARQDVTDNEADLGTHAHVWTNSSMDINKCAMEETSDIEMDTIVSQKENDVTDDESSKENFRWSHIAVLLLLEEYRKREKDMSSGKLSHKKAWNQIADIMNAKGYFVTGRQCCTKWNTMKRTFKSVKDYNKKSGNNKRTWTYYEVMDNLVGAKPYMAPLSTISSTGAETSNTSVSTDLNTNSLSTFSSSAKKNDNKELSCKRKASTNTIVNTILESQRIAEEGKEKRHRERMDSKSKIMEKMDKILEKL